MKRTGLKVEDLVKQWTDKSELTPEQYAAAVLPLLPPSAEARWRYLAHLVAAPLPEGHAPDSVLHTELAQALIAAALAALDGSGGAAVARRPTAPRPAGPPSAPGSVAAMNLLRLAARWDDAERRERGGRTIEAMRARWAKTPQALPQLLCALELALEPPRQIVLAGDPRAADFRALAAVTAEQLGPHRVLLAADGGEGQRWLATRAPWLADMKPLGGAATAYLCEDYVCHAPARTADELRALLARR
jgi:uncharacterized protein YyaL (SSP411 family)